MELSPPSHPARRGIWPTIKKIWITAGISVTVVFVGWSLVAYRANEEARTATVGDSLVGNERANGIWKFSPRHDAAASPTGLLFFPGALVDPTAYAPLARAVAAAGHRVTIVELPRRGAFGGANDPILLGRAFEQTRQAGGPGQWVVAGHSRGAVAAVDFAAAYPAAVAGLVLIGTTHPRDVDLSALTAPVTKLVGTRDGIAPEHKSEANRRLLPRTTRWIRIEGGNHSQFGWYGFQPLDRFAEISAHQQQRQMLSAIFEMLRAVSDSSSVSGAPNRF
jgi:pimeloyl-ACP methyl ester carboxylesterase